MGTTAEKLQAILTSKAAIKTAIEDKGVTVGNAPLDEYAGLIGSIPSSGGDTSDATATAADIASGKTAYIASGKVTGTMPENKFKSLVDRSITSVTADDLAGVTSIGDYAFSYCKSLTSVEIPNGVTTIQNAAFYFCENLALIVISDSVTSIGRNAFEQGGYAKKKFIIGSGISTIEFASFRYNFRTVFFAIKATTVPTLVNSNAFTDTNNCPIYVIIPDDYKAATNWTTYASRIFPLVATVTDLANIDTATYTKACVIGADKSYKEYAWDGSQWNEVT